jgi:hypothetical protein
MLRLVARTASPTCDESFFNFQFEEWKAMKTILLLFLTMILPAASATDVTWVWASGSCTASLGGATLYATWQTSPYGQCLPNQSRNTSIAPGSSAVCRVQEIRYHPFCVGGCCCYSYITAIGSPDDWNSSFTTVGCTFPAPPAGEWDQWDDCV